MLRRVGARVFVPCIGAVLSLAMVVGLAGCGASRVIPYTGPGGGGGGGGLSATPPGTYALTVTGAAAGLTHSVSLSVTVQ